MTKVTTKIERNPKAATVPSQRILSCVASANKAVWETFLNFSEYIQGYIEHTAIRILVTNDGVSPHSVVIEIKLKGHDNFQFERFLSVPFDASCSSEVLESQIRSDIKKQIIFAISGTAASFKTFLKELEKNISTIK